MEENTTTATLFKQCNECQQDRPLTDEFFHRAKISKDGFRGKCKECRQPVLRQTTRALRMARKRQGLCTDCGGAPLADRPRCQSCMERCATQSRGHKRTTHADGVCTKCRIAPVERPEKWLCCGCAEISRGTERRRHANRIAAGLCYVCGKEPFDDAGHRCSACSEKRNRSHRESNARIRAKVYAAYGNQCQCCKESDVRFLTLDHVNGDGAEERRRNRGLSGLTLMRRLIRQGFPGRYRLLCWNCNCGSHIYGVCPHKEISHADA